MKNTLLCLCLILAGIHQCTAQGASDLRRKLLSYHLLTAEDTSVLILTDDYPLQMSTGEILSAIGMADLTSHLQERLALEVSGQPVPPLPKARQDSVNKVWLAYLGRLRSAGLVYPVAYSADSADILHGGYRYLDDMLVPLALRQQQLDFFGAAQLSGPLDSLLRAGLLSQQDHDRLMNDARAYRITSVSQIIPYLSHTVHIDLRHYSDKDTTAFVEHVYRDISRLVPELAFQDLRYTIDWDNYWRLSSDKHPTQVRLRANGRTYTQEGVIYTDKPDTHPLAFTGKIDVDEICPIYNRMLEDVHSPYRLAGVDVVSSSKYDTVYDPAQFTIIALTLKQYNAFLYHKDYFDISPTDYQNGITVSDMKNALDTLAQIGLMDHLSAEVRHNATAAAMDTSVYDIVSVLHFFPDLIYSFDATERPKTGPYSGLMLHLRSLSHGAFACDTPSYDFLKSFSDTLGISFTLKGKKYSRAFRNSRGFFDRKFFALLNEAVADAKLPGKFYRIASYQGHVYDYRPSKYQILYLTERQKEALNKHQLFVVTELE